MVGTRTETDWTARAACRDIGFHLAAKRLDRVELAGVRRGIQHDAPRTAPRHAGVFGRRPVPRPYRDFYEGDVEAPRNH